MKVQSQVRHRSGSSECYRGLDWISLNAIRQDLLMVILGLNHNSIFQSYS